MLMALTESSTERADMPIPPAAPIHLFFDIILRLEPRFQNRAALSPPSPAPLS